jgi:hypothetical protein
MRLPTDRHHRRTDRSRMPVHRLGILARPGRTIRIQSAGNPIHLFDAGSGKRIP